MKKARTVNQLDEEALSPTEHPMVRRTRRNLARRVWRGEPLPHCGGHRPIFRCAGGGDTFDEGASRPCWKLAVGVGRLWP